MTRGGQVHVQNTSLITILLMMMWLDLAMASPYKSSTLNKPSLGCTIVTSAVTMVASAAVGKALTTPSSASIAMCSNITSNVRKERNQGQLPTVPSIRNDTTEFRNEEVAAYALHLKLPAGVAPVARSNLYRARINVDRKFVSLGTFSCPHAAHDAYVFAGLFLGRTKASKKWRRFFTCDRLLDLVCMPEVEAALSSHGFSRNQLRKASTKRVQCGQLHVNAGDSLHCVMSKFLYHDTAFSLGCRTLLANFAVHQWEAVHHGIIAHAPGLASLPPHEQCTAYFQHVMNPGECSTIADLGVMCCLLASRVIVHDDTGVIHTFHSPSACSEELIIDSADGEFSLRHSPAIDMLTVVRRVFGAYDSRLSRSVSVVECMCLAMGKAPSQAMILELKIHILQCVYNMSPEELTNLINTHAIHVHSMEDLYTWLHSDYSTGIPMAALIAVACKWYIRVFDERFHELFTHCPSTNPQNAMDVML